MIIIIVTSVQMRERQLWQVVRKDRNGGSEHSTAAPGSYHHLPQRYQACILEIDSAFRTTWEKYVLLLFFPFKKKQYLKTKLIFKFCLTAIKLSFPGEMLLEMLL